MRVSLLVTATVLAPEAAALRLASYAQPRTSPISMNEKPNVFAPLQWLASWGKPTDEATVQEKTIEEVKGLMNEQVSTQESVHQRAFASGLRSMTKPKQTTGTSYLPDDTVERAASGSKFEKIKLAKDTTAVFTDLYDYVRHMPLPIRRVPCFVAPACRYRARWSSDRSGGALTRRQPRFARVSSTGRTSRTPT